MLTSIVGFKTFIQILNSQIPSNEVITQALREERSMFPAIAIRELVANALLHQDFAETGASVMIELYSDRLEISNPGLPAIETDRFIDECKSRNESLAKQMRRVGVCEEKGSGIDKVVHAAEVFQLPAPDFRLSEIRTTVVLFAHLNFEEMDKHDRVRSCYQHCCLQCVMNKKMTNQSLRERFGGQPSQSTVSKIIAETVERGLIKKEAESKKYAHYRPYWQ